ncbi:MAG: phytoene desaturase family protein [Bacteroidales bacterium]
MEKSIIIVGAGISGLSAGYYAQLNGYKTSIFEMHSIPGGLCTAWERKGYKFDISMHMVTASQSGPLHQLWEELGVAEKFRFHYHDHNSCVEGKGKKLCYYTDRKKLEEEMLAISPQDEKLIREFVALIFGRDMMKAASLKAPELQKFPDKLKILPVILPLIPKFIKYNNQTLQDFASRFQDPFLKEAIRFFIDAPGWPMIDFPLTVLTGFMKNGVSEAGTPQGGSQQVVFHMAEKFKELDGKIHYKSKVSELIIENDRATGIRLADGTEHHADQVIWAGDGHHLIYDMLEGKYMNDEISKIYNEWIPVRPIVHVMIGVNRDMSAEPHRIIFEPDEPITIAGEEFRWMTFLHHCFDKSMAPEGKSAVEVWYDTHYEYWEELAKDRKAYKAEKKRIADYTVAQLDKRWPGFASQVEVIDVPTPHSYVRYTGNWKGSPDGWYITPENMQRMKPLRKLPGLEGLYMVGQWTMPFTGTIMAALTGRQVVELMCAGDGRRFFGRRG